MPTDRPWVGLLNALLQLKIGASTWPYLTILPPRVKLGLALSKEIGKIVIMGPLSDNFGKMGS